MKSKQRKTIDWPPHGDHIPLFVGLSTQDPLHDGSGLAEPSGNGYTRVEVPRWSSAHSGSFHNLCDVIFPKVTGDGWGEVTHFALFDAIKGGHVLTWGRIEPWPKIIILGKTVKFVAGDLEVSA